MKPCGRSSNASAGSSRSTKCRRSTCRAPVRNPSNSRRTWAIRLPRRNYRVALEDDPNLFEALYGLAILEQDDGRAADALPLARRAVDAAPGDAARSAARAILAVVEPFARGPVNRPRVQDVEN